MSEQERATEEQQGVRRKIEHDKPYFRNDEKVDSLLALTHVFL